MYDNESFNPRAPCGARPQRMSEMQIRYLFQSTRPVWGATDLHGLVVPCIRVSIHAPRVGRDDAAVDTHQRDRSFNPRAPCGARRVATSVCDVSMLFQSTRPVWGATRSYLRLLLPILVSIHAPRVGRDNFVSSSSPVFSCFNPRAPCGARRFVVVDREKYLSFQSTRPVWGATVLSRSCVILL